MDKNTTTMAAPSGGATPTLSIVIPAYNVERYIADAVASALGQTFADIEVVVIDDGSTDTTPAILAAIAAERRDPRLRIVRKPNGGLAAARNTGIRYSAGRYIGFLDGDDIWCPQKAEKQIALMEAGPGTGISFSYSEYMLEDGTRTGRLLTPEIARPGLAQMIRRNHVGNGSSPIVRRACFDRAGLFDETLLSCEDYEMWCRILHGTASTAALLPESLTLYRLRETSLCFAFDRFLENADRAVDLLQERIPELPPRIFSAARAEHYRITAWKALSSGHPEAAERYMRMAIRLFPWLLVSDWRALGTAVAIAVRKSGSSSLQSAFAFLLERRRSRQEATS